MLPLSSALSQKFWEPPGKTTTMKKGSKVLRMPSWTSVRGIWSNLKKRGEIPYSQFCLLAPLLISQTTKEVWYQELWACRQSTTVECLKYIMNMQYAICKGRFLLDGLGLNQCLLIGNPLPRSRIGCLMCFQGGFGDFLLSMNYSCRDYHCSGRFDLGYERPENEIVGSTNAAAVTSSVPKFWEPSRKQPPWKWR